MRRLPLYTGVRFRLGTEKDFSQVLEWFRSPTFYFLSKRPDFLTENQILNLIKNSYIFFNVQGNPIGIAKIVKETFLSKEIKIAFKDNELYKNDEGIGYFLNFLKMLFYDLYLTPYVYQLIYEFDEPSIILCENAGMNLDGTLESHIYKWGKYHKVFVYGMTRERFGEITGLKCERE